MEKLEPRLKCVISIPIVWECSVSMFPVYYFLQYIRGNEQNMKPVHISTGFIFCSFPAIISLYTYLLS